MGGVIRPCPCACSWLAQRQLHICFPGVRTIYKIKHIFKQCANVCLKFPSVALYWHALAATSSGRFGISIILFKTLYTKISLLFNCVRKPNITVGEKFFCSDVIKVQLLLKEQRNILHEISKRKANWIGHILRRNCLLQRVIEGKIKGSIEVAGRRGRRRRKLLDDLKERRGYCHLKEEALDRTMWRARFGRGFGPVVRQTAKWMKVCVGAYLLRHPL